MYKRPFGRLIIILGLFGPSRAYAQVILPSVSTGGITLQGCYQKARQISENVGISAENTRLVQAQYRADLGNVFPHLDWVASRFFQQNKSNTVPGSAAGSTLLSSQPESYFQLQQPIFAGFRDWQVVGISKSQEEQARLNQRATDLQLLSDVSAAFYLAYTLQDQLVVLQDTRKLNQDQVDQLSHWVNIGRSRPSERLSAETQLASLDAQIEDTKRSLAEARHLLLFLTGVPADVTLQDAPPVPSSLSMDEALNRAGQRPDILSTVESLHQAELGIRYAQGGHAPTLGFLGRYYTERFGILTDVRWDATFTLDVPIYAGGSTQALVRVARSQQIIAQLTLGRLKRDVERDVRTAYDDLAHASSEYAAYEKAVQLAEKNYEVQKKEYRTGVISNLDLLQLLTNMQNIRGQWLTARANAKLDDIRLHIAMGEGL